MLINHILLGGLGLMFGFAAAEPTDCGDQRSTPDYRYEPYGGACALL